MTDDDKALVAQIRKEASIQIGFDGFAYQTLTRWADRIEALSAENEKLRRDHTALAKQLDIAQRKLKGVTKQWHTDRAALGDTK